MNKQFLIVIAVIILGLFGVLMLTREDSGNENASTNTDITPTNHVVGKTDSNVTLIEYGDFQCPACRAYIPIVEQIKAEYSDEISFQFRHFPLVSIHPNAFIAGRAAEAAALQDKFYEMHDILYEQQDLWSSATDPTDAFVRYADELGIDGAKLREDMQTALVGDKINADTSEAQKLGATGTPSFVLNGELIETPRSFDEFKVILDEAIKANKN